MTAIVDPRDFLRGEMKKSVHDYSFLAMKRAADEIDLLRDAVAELISEADNPWPSHTDIGAAVDRALSSGSVREVAQ